MEATRCKFWGIRSNQADANQESCDQVKDQNWMGKILTMMSMRMYPTVLQAVTQVVLTGYASTVNAVKEQWALAFVPELFLEMIRILGKDHSDRPSDDTTDSD